MKFKDFENMLVTTRLGYVDECNMPLVTEERNLFFFNNIKSCSNWDRGKGGFGIKAKDIETLQYSKAFNFPELLEKNILTAGDFSDKKLKKGDFNKEFKFHESHDGDYFMYFTWADDVYRIRGVEVMYELDGLYYVFNNDEFERVSSNKYLITQLVNYEDTILSIGKGDTLIETIGS